MEISQLKYFVAAAEKMHFALAAESLQIAQPSLSRGIQTLEKELGVRLFNRSNKRRIELTESGKAFLPHARNILQQLLIAERSAKDTAEGISGHLAIGALESTLERKEFLETLTAMQKNHRGITLEIIDDHSFGLADRLLERSVDLILCRHDKRLFRENIICRKLFDDEILLAIPKDHPLAEREKVPVQLLKDEKLIMVPEKTSPAFYGSIIRYCREKGNFEIKTSEICSNFYTAQHLAEAGFGIALVPESHKDMYPEHLAYRHFQGTPPCSTVYTALQDDSNSYAIDVFLKLLRGYFKSSF